MRIIENIPVKLNPEKVIKELRLNKEKSLTAVLELLETAEPLIQPIVSYKVAYINEKGKDTIKINGVTFSSRVLRINLEKTEKVFPFIITIGKGLETRASASKDLLQQFCLENIGDMALGLCEKYLERHLKKQHGLEKLASMSPGSLDDWPVTEQKPLFSLFGEKLRLTGVKLNEHLLMIPRKSVSGLYFPTEVTFSSCQLCHREHCSARKAPFDKELKKKYGLDEE